MVLRKLETLDKTHANLFIMNVVVDLPIYKRIVLQCALAIIDQNK